MLVSNYKV